MHFLLEKLLGKRGIKDTTVLDESEKQTYDNWQRILSEGDISVEKIKEFCKQQLSVIEGKFKEMDNNSNKNLRLIISHNIYRAIIDCIEKPRHEREQLEKYLQQILDS